MSNKSFKVKNGLTLTPVDLTTLTSAQAGDIACDINDSNKIKRYDGATSTWVVVGSGLSAWATGSVYAVNDVVSYSKQAFICLTAHTAAATMEADIAAGKWQLMNVPMIGRNYMLVGNNFEDNDVGGFQLFTIAGYVAGSNPSVAPTLGSAASLTVSTTSSSPISGAYSLVIGNTASTNITAGQGIISQAFTIDRIDQAKVLATQFAYEVAAGSSNMVLGTTSANTFGVFIYDVTNSAWIQPAGVYSINQGSGVGKTPSCNWQTPSNMTQFKVAILCMNSTNATTPAANALQVKFDDFFTGPSNYVYGSPITDFVNMGAITINATTTAPTKGTVILDRVLGRRVGDSLEAIFEYTQSTVGTAGSGVYLFKLPNNLSFDLNKVNAPSAITTARVNNMTKIGEGQLSLSVAAGYNANVHLYAYDSTRFVAMVVSSQNNAGAGDSSVDEDFGSATYGLLADLGFRFHITAPIQGWSSSVQMSDSADTRVCAASYYLSSGFTASPTIPINFDTKEFDTHSATSVSATAWKFTAPIAGIYAISGVAYSGALAVTDFMLYKNGTIYKYLASGNNASIHGNWATEVNLNAGDYIDIRPHTSTSISGGGLSSSVCAQVTITRLSGPSAIAASETVAASYYASANASCISQSPANFDSKDYDTHNAVTTGASWKFTAPVAGIYDITALMQVTNAGWFGVYKNGAAYKTFGYNPNQNVHATSIKLNAGDYIYITCTSTNTTITGGAIGTNTTGWINIARRGL